jgi:hypothetical protein
MINETDEPKLKTGMSGKAIEKISALIIKDDQNLVTLKKAREVLQGLLKSSEKSENPPEKNK